MRLMSNHAYIRFDTPEASRALLAALSALPTPLSVDGAPLTFSYAPTRSPAPQNTIDSDWRCVCGFVNFAHRRNCKTCQRSVNDQPQKHGPRLRLDGIGPHTTQSTIQSALHMRPDLPPVSLAFKREQHAPAPEAWLEFVNENDAAAAHHSLFIAPLVVDGVMLAASPENQAPNATAHYDHAAHQQPVDDRVWVYDENVGYYYDSTHGYYWDSSRDVAFQYDAATATTTYYTYDEPSRTYEPLQPRKPKRLVTTVVASSSPLRGDEAQVVAPPETVREKPSTDVNATADVPKEEEKAVVEETPPSLAPEAPQPRAERPAITQGRHFLVFAAAVTM